MLRSGVPLDQIGLVLRHRSIDMSAYYAKVDVALLRSSPSHGRGCIHDHRRRPAILALRRGAGFVLSNAEYLLRSFARFAADRQERHIRTATVIDWASRAPSSRNGTPATKPSASSRTCPVWKTLDTNCRRPNHFGHSKTRRVPHIYSAGRDRSSDAGCDAIVRR